MEALSRHELWEIAVGTCIGLIARLLALRVDQRQIPSYPSSVFSTVVLGFIASALGAVAIPALLAKDYTAVTFLSLAIQQFREVRKMEADSFMAIDESEPVKRGKAYIDGIAKTFESRNFFSVISSIVTVLAMRLLYKVPQIFGAGCGIIAGMAAFFLCYRFSKGKRVRDICTVAEGKLEVRGSELYVDGIYVTNQLGPAVTRSLFEKEGIAAVVSPKAFENRVTLENPGQQQAVLYEAVRSLGVKRYQFVQRDLATGKLIVAFVPILRDFDMLVRAVYSTPVLENSRKVKRIMSMTEVE